MHIKGKLQKGWCMGIVFVMLIFITNAGCSKLNSSDSTPQLTLKRAIEAVKANNKDLLGDCIARDSELDVEGFLKAKESTNTEELLRRIKLRALTEALLGQIEHYSVTAEKEIKENSKELSVEAKMKNSPDSAQKEKIVFRFTRQDGEWKLTDWQGIKYNN